MKNEKMRKMRGRQKQGKGHDCVEALMELKDICMGCLKLLHSIPTQ